MVSDRSKEVKTLGRSEENGGYIVELTNREFRSLAALSEAVEGMPINWYDFERAGFSPTDLAEAFVAVREYVITLDIVNQMQHRLDEMKKILQANKRENEPSYEQLHDEAKARL